MVGDIGPRWRRASALTALVSSTFSTLFVLVASRHIGRDPKVDFMEVGMVPLRTRAIASPPPPAGVVSGVLAHQGADIMWALIWFRLIQPRLRRRRGAVLGAAAPWALLTAAAEYFVFLPWVQPWLRMQVPYWTASLVHVSSSASYPLFPWMAEGDPRDRRLGMVTLAAMASLVAGAAALTVRNHRGRDPRWPGVTTDGPDGRFLYCMHGHHVVGLRLSELAAERSGSHELRALGRLMAAQHAAEIGVMRSWWRGWFGGEVPELGYADRMRMGGMPAPEEVAELARMSGREFDRRFVEVMAPHHRGAIRMSDDAWTSARDPRVRLFADGIRHTQTGQVEVMERHR